MDLNKVVVGMPVTCEHIWPRTGWTITAVFRFKVKGLPEKTAYPVMHIRHQNPKLMPFKHITHKLLEAAQA